MENRIRFKIGDIEFEAEGSTEIIERERNVFMQHLLPAAIDAISKTRIQIREHADICNGKIEHADVPAIESREIEDAIILHGSDIEIKEDYSKMNLIAYINSKGTLTEQEFTLFAAYFDEKKNQKKYFTKEDVEKYYAKARRKKSSNISMSLTRLVKKGFIMDVEDVEQKIPKPYCISSEGIKFINEFHMRDEKEKKTIKVKNNRTKIKSEYEGINVDDLNLSKYPNIAEFKNFKEKMMMVIYIVTTENAGEWFGTSDVMFLLTNIFGEQATKDQVNGVFRREKLWFKAENIDENKKDVKRKLLNQGIAYAKSLMEIKKM